MMDPQEKELLEFLKARGVDTGKWENRPGRTSQIRSLEQLRPLLRQLRGCLEQQIQGERNKIQQLREVVHRLKHGGGK